MAGEAFSAEATLPNILVGRFHAYFIYDVANTLDLARLQSTGGERFQKTQLDLRAVSSPSYIQFVDPPLLVKLPTIRLDEQMAEVQVKLYDYGTIAIRFSFDYTGSWSGFAELTHKLRQSDRLPQCADKLLKDVLEKAEEALRAKHEPILEDYFVLEVESFEPRVTSSELLDCYKGALASLILSEKRTLIMAEQEEALKIRFSYFDTDLAVIHWDAAFVFDTREGAEAVESILEFANTQLVELRSYDARLDAELDSIYKWNLLRARPHWLWGRRAASQQSDRLRCLLVDIRELADRANNALKIIGDAFYARLYRGAALRFGLSDWQQQIESKLNSVGEVYRFATDEAQHTRSEFLEIIVILLITVEILLAIWRAGH
jgi:hypothetical protein